MASLRLAAALCAALALATTTKPCRGLSPRANPQVAPGVRFKVLANDLDQPRGIVADSRGGLLVVEQGSGAIRRLVLDRGRGLDTCVVSSTRLAAGGNLNHGIQLAPDGKTLFASSRTDVYAYAYDADKGTAGTPRSIITGMDQTGHKTRTLLIPRHDPNLLLVSRGSDANTDVGAAQVASARSQIRVFAIDELLRRGGPVPYSDGKVLGWGLRNSVGVGEDPTTGNIWSVENSIDDMKRRGVDIHNSNPGEELNFHGRPGDAKSAFYGKNYGYPPCVTIFDSSDVQGYPGGARTGLPMVGDQMNSSHAYTDAWCRAETVAPSITFGSHLAPLDIKFRPDGKSALISFHGSWNRKPPNGYRLSRLAFSHGFPVADRHGGDAEQQLMWNADTSVCPEQCFRPVGLALDARGGGDGVFMTSDSTGELFIVTGTDA